METLVERRRGDVMPGRKGEGGGDSSSSSGGTAAGGGGVVPASCLLASYTLAMLPNSPYLLVTPAMLLTGGWQVLLWASGSMGGQTSGGREWVGRSVYSKH